MLKILGISGETPPTCLAKSDKAGGLENAVAEVGLVPETSLPGRWPHNSELERGVRGEKETCRSDKLESGLPYEIHTCMPLHVV